MYDRRGRRRLLCLQLVSCVVLLPTLASTQRGISMQKGGGGGGATVTRPKSGNVVAMSDEKRLIKHLLLQYETIGVVGRPVYNISETVKVYYGLALIQLLDLDEKNQVLTTNVWSRYNWHDILLTWDPEEYGGVDHVRVPVAKIWTPDIVLYNYADTRLKEHRDTMAVISSDGRVLWIPPAIFRSTCPIDITNFPFDEQICHLKFGSWTYDGYKLDIQFYENLEKVDTRDYVDSNEWSLVDVPAKKNIRYYPCCSDLPFPDLTFTIRLKRIAIFYNYVLILPCVLLSFLTLVIFWLPPESPAKMMLADNTPPAASAIPLIGAYFCMNMVLITLSTFLAVIVIQTHIRSDCKNGVPDWLKKLTIDGLARVLCMDEALDRVQRRNRSRPSQQQPSSSSSPPPSNPSLSTNHPSFAVETGGLRPSGNSLRCLRAAAAISAAAADDDDEMRRYTTRLEYHVNDADHATDGAYNARALKQQQQQQQTANELLQEVVTNNGCYDSRLPRETVFVSRAARSAAVAAAASERDRVLENDVNEIKRILKAYMVRLNDKDSNARVTKEWRLVARVLDRLFFFMYVSTIIVSIATIFPRTG